MLTERAAGLTTKYPWLGIAVIGLVSMAAVGAMMIWPMEESFDQEQFMPDMEVARANMEYSDKFTSTYSLIVLVRSEAGDMVTKEGFTDTILLSENLINDSTYKEWRDPGDQGAYPVSPAASLFQMRQAVDFAEDLVGTGSEIGTYFQVTSDLNESSSVLSSSLETADPTDAGTLEGIASNISAVVDDFLENALVPETGGPAYSNALEYYQSIPDDDGLKDDIGELLSFNFSDPKIGNSTYTLLGYSAFAVKVQNEVDAAVDSIDGILSEGGLSNSSRMALEAVKDDLEEAGSRLEALSGISAAKGNPLALGRMTQLFYFGQFVLVNFLTEDFDPFSGQISAEGCIMVLNLDYRLGQMMDEDQNRLLEIEGNISDVVKDFDDGSNLSIHPLAFAQIDREITNASNRSMQILLPLALIFVVVILFFIYRNLFDMVLNIFALGLAILWMYGFGSLMGYTTNPMITAVPVLIVGLGIDYGIHLTMRYREEIRKGKLVREALTSMSKSVGMALLLATFTTVLAFLSNILSPVGIILQFGVMSAVGILASFFIMLIFVPSVKRLRDVRRARIGKPLFLKYREGECDLCMKEENNKRIVNRVLLGLTLRAERHPAIILTIVALITLGMLGAALNSEIVFDVNDFLPDDLQESSDLKYLMSEFRLGGSGDTGVILVEGDITDPELLIAMNDTMGRAVEYGSEFISMEGEGGNRRPSADFILYSLKDTASFLGVLDPSNPFLTSYSETFDFNTGLPKEGATSEDIGNVFDIFYEEFPSEARRVLYRDNGNYTMAAISFTVGTDSDKEAWELYDDLKVISEPLEDMEGGKVDKVYETGSSIVFAVVISAMQQSQINSLLITIIVSLVVLTIVFFIEERSLVLGLVATLPVVFCVIWIVGTMYFVGIPLNVMTITIGALTVGLGITYGIHITHRFVEDVRVEEDLMEASRNTLMNTGSALFGAAATTVAGFGLLTFATMPPLQQFGQVTALAIIYSFISSVVVLPVLLIIWAKGRSKWRKRTGRDIFNGKEKE
ncbi:MAG: efflux RND transporter permease subunit [Thermoplasmatota archaeon]